MTNDQKLGIINEAKELYSKRNNSNLLSFCESHLLNDQSNPYLWFYKAAALSRMDVDTQKSDNLIIEALQNAIKYGADNHEIIYNTIVLYSIKRYDRELSRIVDNFEFNKNREDGLDSLSEGIYLYYKKNYKSAIDKLTISLNKKADSLGFNIRGICYRYLNEPEKAIEDYRMSIKTDKKNPGPYINLGLLLFRKNHLKESIEWLNHGYDYYNKNQKIKVKTYLALSYDMLSNKEEAALAYKEAMILDDYKNLLTLTNYVEYLKKFTYEPEDLLAILLKIDDENLASYTLETRTRYAKLKSELLAELENEPHIDKQIKRIMTLSESNEAIQNTYKIKQQSKNFIAYSSNNDDNEWKLHILRKWNSFTPILESNYDNSNKGGGYFLQKGSKGIVIDPGYDFIYNFQSRGFKFNQITEVLITHAHDDHTADVESILTLLYKYNQDVKQLKSTYSENDDELLKEKEITFYVSINVYKKFMVILDLQENIRVEVVKPGEIFQIGSITVEVLKAYHNDIISDNHSLGFMMSMENSLLIYTGDSGYRKELEIEYEELKVRNSKKDIILLAHFGGIKPEESKFYRSKENYEKAFYKNHLGRLGLANLIRILKPKMCIVSEFGDEFRKARIEICNIFGQVYNKTRFFPADIGLSINAKFEINSIIKDNTGGFSFQFLKFDQVGTLLSSVRDYTLYYYDKNLEAHKVIDWLSMTK